MKDLNIEITITRNVQNDKCTTGEMVVRNYAMSGFNDGEIVSFECKTLELPWLQNQRDISCIPTGIYKCQKIQSPNLGHCIEILDVPNRELVRIHKGNFTSQILGCILVGEMLVDFDGDGVTDVTNSKQTLKHIMSIVSDEFMMEIA